MMQENQNVGVYTLYFSIAGTGTNVNKEILEEAYIMASVDHPNLLQLLAVCMTTQIMLVTQLMPLGCLLDYVRNNKDKVKILTYSICFVRMAWNRRVLVHQSVSLDLF